MTWTSPDCPPAVGPRPFRYGVVPRPTVVARPSFLRRGDFFGLRGFFFFPPAFFFLRTGFFFAAAFFLRAFFFLAIRLEVYHCEISETTRSHDGWEVSLFTICVGG